MSNPSLWATDFQGKPYFYEYFGSNAKGVWKEQQRPSTRSSRMKITPGKQGIWIVDDIGETFFRYRVTLSDRLGQYWGRLLPNELRLRMIHYGANNEVIGVTDTGNLVSRQGISSSSPTGIKWKVLGKGYKSVSVSFYGYWLIDRNNQVRFSSYTPSSNIVGELKTVLIPEVFKKVSAGFGSNVWALDFNGRVWQRMEINTLNPSGSRWQILNELKLKDISAGYVAT